MNVLQVEEGATVLQTAKDADAEEKAALDHVQQQRQLLIDENQACQDAIGDVHERKKVMLLQCRPEYVYVPWPCDMLSMC